MDKTGQSETRGRLLHSQTKAKGDMRNRINLLSPPGQRFNLNGRLARRNMAKEFT